MNILKEFKEFAVKGNVIDMAIGIIIGASFGKIVSSAVNDLIMPPVGLLIGGMDFSNLNVLLKGEAGTNTAVYFKYGVFINNIIDFLILAFVMFFIIKLMNKLKKEKSAEPEAPREEIVLLTEIRDLLKGK